MLQDRRGLGLGLGVSMSSFIGGIQPFIISVKTDNLSAGSSTATQFKLPLPASGTYNFSVDWGDSNSDTITVYNQAQATHTYSTAGTYTVKILGICIGWQFANTGDRLKLLDISQYGCLNISTRDAFWGCGNLTGTAIDAPKITSATLQYTFAGCSKFNGNVSGWNTSGVTNMLGLFSGCSLFNQSVGTWNMASATEVSSMFNSCSVFNNGGSSSINSWTFAPTSITSMFGNCIAFNQPVGNWNVSNATDFSQVFTGCTVFNQNVGTWNVAKATSFFFTFYNCTVFNNGGSADIGNWTFNGLSNVNMRSIFHACPAFNQPINWNVKAIGTTQTFNGCTVFNQNIGNWNMSASTGMNTMFGGAVAFNNGGSPDINNWNVSSVTDMGAAFSSCYAFNQPIGNWNTANVTNMGGMFNTATAFNQNIGAWNVTKVIDFSYMFANCPAFNNGGSSTINNWVINTTATSVNMFGVFLFAYAFNQPINNWNVSKVSTMTFFMLGHTAANYLAANYDSILNSWSALSLKPNVALDMGSVKYTAAGSAGRAILTSAPNNWTVIDGGI